VAAEAEVLGDQADDLETAINDGGLLLEYCAESGIQVDAAIVKTLVSARRDELTDSDAETKFWLALTQAATLAKPATIEGLRADDDPTESSPKLRRYQLWAWICVALLIVLQVDWLVGSNLLKDLDELDTTHRQQSLVIAQKMDTLGEKAGANVELQQLVASRMETNAKIGARVQLLGRWNKVNLFALLAGVKNPTQQLVAEQAARFQLTLIKLYLLPLVYGWLGATIFVLRTSSRQITERSFSPAIHRSYRLREAMGALAGLAIAWVIGGTTSSSSTSNAIGPEATAFVAGYSVDIVFTAIDKIVAAFSAPAAKLPPTA
jgi:hypothetical protein